MIDLQSAYVRAVLQGVTTRVALAAEALDWADGLQTLDSTELVADLKDEVSLKAWRRLAKQVQGLGPRAVAHKRTAAIGSVSWGGDNPNGIDDRLVDLDLDRLAVTALKRLVAVGISGVLPHQPETGQPRLQNMGGHIEPLYDEDDIGGTPAAWLQVLAEADGRKYRLRLYEPDPGDPARGTLTEWRNANQPYELGNAPTEQWTGVLMPTVVMVDTAQDGTPLGELTQALPLLKGEVAQQLRILRAADANSWPKRWMSGDWDVPESETAETVLVATDPASSVGVIDPPKLEGLFALHDRMLDRVRADLKLPITSITTGTFPSGEALDQANAISISTAKELARLVQTLLTGGVRGLCELLNIPRDKAPPVSVEINREQTRRMVTEQARADFAAGLIPRRVAVLTVSQYYPHWSDGEIDEFLAEIETQATAAREAFQATSDDETEDESEEGDDPDFD